MIFCLVAGSILERFLGLAVRNILKSFLLVHCGGGQDMPGCLGPSAKLPRHFYFFVHQPVETRRHPLIPCAVAPATGPFPHLSDWEARVVRSARFAGAKAEAFLRRASPAREDVR